MKKTITLKLSEVDINKLNKLAEQRGTTKSNIVREALAEYLSETATQSTNSFADIAA
jgi:predicted DNA-binding protein